MLKSLIRPGIAGINIVSAYIVIVATELKIAVTIQARRGILADVVAEELLPLLLLKSSSFLSFCANIATTTIIIVNMLSFVNQNPVWTINVIDDSSCQIYP